MFRQQKRVKLIQCFTTLSQFSLRDFVYLLVGFGEFFFGRVFLFVSLFFGFFWQGMMRGKLGVFGRGFPGYMSFPDDVSHQG